MAAAEAGYYSMSVPAELGGAGMGMLAYFVVWERIYRLCGSHNWLGAYTVSHWAFGPSPVLLMVTDRARAEILTGMMEGRTSMCFGMSEPGAGSDATTIQTKAVRSGSAGNSTAARSGLPTRRRQTIASSLPSPIRTRLTQGGRYQRVSGADQRHLASRWRASSVCMARWAATRVRSCWRMCSSSRGSWSVNCTTASGSDCWASQLAASTIQHVPWDLAAGRWRWRCATHNNARPLASRLRNTRA